MKMSFKKLSKEGKSFKNNYFGFKVYTAQSLGPVSGGENTIYEESIEPWNRDHRHNLSQSEETAGSSSSIDTLTSGEFTENLDRHQSIFQFEEIVGNNEDSVSCKESIESQKRDQSISGSSDDYVTCEESTEPWDRDQNLPESEKIVGSPSIGDIVTYGESTEEQSTGVVLSHSLKLVGPASRGDILDFEESTGLKGGDLSLSHSVKIVGYNRKGDTENAVESTENQSQDLCVSHSLMIVGSAANGEIANSNEFTGLQGTDLNLSHSVKIVGHPASRDTLTSEESTRAQDKNLRLSESKKVHGEPLWPKKDCVEELRQLAQQVQHHIKDQKKQEDKVDAPLVSEVENLGFRITNLTQAITQLSSNLEQQEQEDEHNESDEEGTESPVTQLQENIVLDEPLLPLSYNGLKDLSTSLKKNSVQQEQLMTLGGGTQISEVTRSVFECSVSSTGQASYQQVLAGAGDDIEAALETWSQYVATVEANMATPAPASREGLYETSRMCQAHSSVLKTQTEVLNTLEEKAQKNDAPQHLKDLRGRLKELLLSHETILGTVSEKEANLSQTITQWDKYRCKVAQLQSWLLSLEQEKQELQLRQVPQKRLQKVIDRLHHLIEQLAVGEEQVEEVSNICQEQLLTSCDSSIHPVLKAELASLQQRVKNLHAGLQTWLTYLQRCTELWTNFQNSFNNLQEILATHQSQVSQELPKEFPLIQESISQYQEAIKDLEALACDLTQLRTLREELVESLTPADSRLITQRMWRVTQHQAELIHEYKMKINTLEDQLESWELYDTKYTNFIRWTEDMEEKIIGGSEQYIDTLIRKLEYDFIKEINSKSLEKLWLTTEGEKLISCSNTEQVEEINDKMKTIKDTWTNLNFICNNRRQKLQDIVDTIKKAETTLADLKNWLFTVEKKLSSPVIFLYKSKREIDRLLEIEEELRNEIENQSSTILTALELCNTVIKDCKEFDADGDTDSIQEVHSNLDLRWMSIKSRSEERKTFIKKTWKMWEELESVHKTFTQWLTSIENRLAGVSAAAAFLSYADLSKTAAHVYQLQKDIHDHTLNYEELNQKYRLLARPYGKDNRLDHENEIRGMVKSANSRFHKLSHQVTLVLRRLRYSAKLYEDFDTKREYLTIWLTELTKQLTKYEHESFQDPQIKTSALLVLTNEYEKRHEELSSFENVITLMYQRSCYCDCTNIDESLIDYWNLKALLYTKLDTLYDKPNENIAQITPKEKEITSDTVDMNHNMESVVVPEEVNNDNNNIVIKENRPLNNKLATAELITALQETQQLLQQLEADLNNPIQNNEDDIDNVDSFYQSVSGQLAASQASVDALVSLGESMEDNPDAQQLLLEVAQVTETFRQLQAKAEAKQPSFKDSNLESSSSPQSQSCELCSQHNLDQYDNDMTHLEECLTQAEEILTAHSETPADMSQIELAAQAHREFLMEVECHKAVVVSLKTVGGHFAEHLSDRSHGSAVKERLNATNSRWQAICDAAAAWQNKLQVALIGNTEFLKTIEDLLVWTEAADADLQNMKFDKADNLRIKECVEKVIEVQSEVERCHPRVAVLYEASQHWLDSDELKLKVSDFNNTNVAVNRSDTIAVRRQLELLDGRLGDLSLLCQKKLKKISQRTGKSLPEILAMLDMNGVSSRSSADNTLVHPSPLSLTPNGNLETEGKRKTIVAANTVQKKRSWWNFICRVMRAALPIYAFMLLLLAFMWAIVPSSEDQLSCSMSNTFARSFDPMLRYTNGPPPF